MQEMAADDQALWQALAGLEAALKGDLQTIAAFREVCWMGVQLIVCSTVPLCIMLVLDR